VTCYLHSSLTKLEIANLLRRLDLQAV